MPIKQSTLDDLVIQCQRLIGTVNAILERYVRAYEEIDNTRLSLEEIRELIKDLIDESGRFADGLSKKMDRLERYTILVRIVGSNQETTQIEGVVSREHIEQALREELVNQQNLMAQYQKNINKVRLSIAKYGETVPLTNELETYEIKLEKAQETINRIRESLGFKQAGKAD